MNVVYFVKQFILFFVVASFLVYSPVASAKTLSTAQKEAMLDRIEMLLEQVQKLQKQLALLQSKKASTATGFSYKTKFYTGKYEALYLVDGATLIAPTNTAVRNGDQLLWETFIDIAGVTFSDKYISELRIYNDTKSEISAFVEEKPDGTWIIGFNREGKNIANIYNDDTVVDLLLHEYSHIVFFNTNGIEGAFKKAFWSGKQSSSGYVTEYAKTNAIEDMVESFVYFVQSDKPTQKSVAYDKIRFFYNYPKLVTLRQELRKTDLF